MIFASGSVALVMIQSFKGVFAFPLNTSIRAWSFFALLCFYGQSRTAAQLCNWRGGSSPFQQLSSDSSGQAKCQNLTTNYKWNFARVPVSAKILTGRRVLVRCKQMMDSRIFPKQWLNRYLIVEFSENFRLTCHRMSCFGVPRGIG